MQTFINDLQSNHNRIRNYLGPSTEIGLTTSLALKYTLAGKQYSGVAFQQFHEEIMSKLKMEKWYETFIDYSTASTITYKVVVHLFLHENRELLLEQLMKNELRLKQQGFKKSIYRTIGALILREEVSHETIAYSLYEQMQKKHRFLTGKDDIPYAVLVTADLNKDVVRRAETMHRYYNELKDRGFKIGDSLQALSQILSIYSIDYVSDLVPYVAQLKNELEQRGVNVKRKHYAQLGVLALTLSNEDVVEAIAEMYKQLIATPMLKNEKSIALTIAIQYVVKQQLNVQNTIHLSQVHNVMEVLGITDLTLYASTLFIEGVTAFLPFD